MNTRPALASLAAPGGIHRNCRFTNCPYLSISPHWNMGFNALGVLALLDRFSAKKSFQISRPMDDPEDFSAVEERKIKNEDFLEARYPKHSHGFEARMSEPGIPSDVRLTCKERKRVVRREEKPMAEFRVCDCGVVVGLIVEIPVSLWSEEVAAFAHLVPVFFSRSSRRRCFSSQ